MKQKSIFRQLLIPITATVCALALSLVVIIVAVFSTSYQREIYRKNQDKCKLVAGEISTFLEGAYSMTEELAINPSILTMKTDIQTPILQECVQRNSYLELLYIQGTDGMQTGRSSGELADRSTRWWFVQTMNDPQAFISKSYYSVNTGMPCTSIFFPMYRASDLIGIFAVDIKLDYLQSLIEEFSDIENSEYSFVIDGEGVVVAHPDTLQIEELYNYKTMKKTVSGKDAAGNPLKDANGNIVTEEMDIQISDDFQKVIADVMSGNTGSVLAQNDGETYFVSYASVPLKGNSDNWSVITMQKKSAAMSMVTGVIPIAIVILLIGVGLAVFLIMTLARRLTRPIESITLLIGEASEGDFTMKADESLANELGVLSRSFNKMTGKISGILTRFTTFSRDVVQSSGQLKQIEEDVGEINRSLKEISAGTETQTADVSKVVENAEELERMFERLREKNSLLLKEMENMIASEENGVKSVDGLKAQNSQTTDMMEESYKKIMLLEKQSQKISGIVNTINEISSQTSLLALNASIEAARAGDAGRGFSVVAESIGKLAQDSSDATSDIKAIIEALCRDIRDTVEDIQSVKAVIDEQVSVVDGVKETFLQFKSLAESTKLSVNDMEALVNEMHSCDLAMVNTVEQIRDISCKTSALAEQAAGSLSEQLTGICTVSAQVDQLSEASGEMEREMTKFKL